MPRDTWCNLPEDKRARIMRAAMEEFGARGFSAGSLNVIAKRAGVAKGSLFQYFVDKLDFFQATTEAVSRSIRDEVERAVGDLSLGYFETLRRLLPVWLDFYRTHPIEQSMAMAVAMELDPEARAAVRSVANAHYADVLLPRARAAAERGEFRPATDPEVVVALTVLVLRHANTAPFADDLDPVLHLADRSAGEVEDVYRSLVDGLERGFGVGAGVARLSGSAGTT